MKIFPYILSILILILSGCSDPLSPTLDPDYSEIQFKITRGSGWGTPWSLMEIYKSGWIKMDRFVQDEWKEGIEISMKSSEMEIFRKMERDFASYNRFYKPEEYYTDQPSHTFILIREVAVTTEVYDYHRSDLPGSLRKGIESVEGIYKRAGDN